MSKKKKHPKKQPPKQVAKKTDPRKVWIIGAVAIVAVIGLVAVLSSGSQGGQTTQTAQSTQGGQTAAPTGEESAYLGRFLPAAYEAPKVAGQTLYTSAIGMSLLTADLGETNVSIPVAQVVEDKIVRFDYERADGEVLPMIAYVKPSGTLFVGVSYCPPCEGEGQRIESDGTLTCEACGTKRNLESNTGISGACKLYPLDEVPASVEADMILVDSSVLDSWTPQPLDRPTS